jgi:hypothetical protein
MNERIRELVKQAGDYVNEVYTPPVRSKTPGKIWEDGHIGWNEQFNEKFAELIVRECAEFARQHNLEKADRSHMIHKAIKEHFGVEE